VPQKIRNLIDERGRKQGLVALYVDHDGPVAPAARRGNFRNPVGSRNVIGPRHHGDGAVGRSRLHGSSSDTCVIGCNQHFVRAASTRGFDDPLDHRPSADRRQGLRRQARRGITRRNDDLEPGHFTCP
jgi:hypothetical protein